jgi:carbonic anhydrase
LSDLSAVEQRKENGFGGSTVDDAGDAIPVQAQRHEDALCPAQPDCITNVGIVSFSSDEQSVGHWSYSGKTGPEHWGEIDKANIACSAGSQQSPLNISSSIKAMLPPIGVSWRKDDGRMVNNGHTVQVNVPPGSTLSRGGNRYALLQYHFHHPSEHLVEGKRFAMEAHFVHQNTESNDLGVLAVLLVPGGANVAFAQLAAAFPMQADAEVVVATVDVNGLLPATLGYWYYEGSLTTPPCTENVDWMLAMQSLEVAEADIAKFAALYPANARTVKPSSRRLVLSSL